jgi:hypothetical protein
LQKDTTMKSLRTIQHFVEMGERTHSSGTGEDECSGRKKLRQNVSGVISGLMLT